MSFFSLTVLWCLVPFVLASRLAPRLPQTRTFANNVFANAAASDAETNTAAAAAPEPTICGDIVDATNQGNFNRGKERT